MASILKPETWIRYGNIDPELSKILENNPRPSFDKAENAAIVDIRSNWEARFKQGLSKTAPGLPSDVVCEEISIPVGENDMARALLYKPRLNASAGRPLLVLFHGGGFCFGAPEMEASTCIQAARSHGVVALSVGYKLAPEVKFPVAVNESWAAVKWLSNNAASLGADPSKGFIVGGTSAGGNIAAVVGHLATDEKHDPPLTGLLLSVAPFLSPEAVPESYQTMYKSRIQNKDAPILNEIVAKMYDDAYQPEISSRLWDVLLWPGGHCNHPPTYFQVCGLDILRDEELIYEKVIREDWDTKTKVDLYRGLPHAFWVNYPTHSKSKQFIADRNTGLSWLLKQE